MPILYPKVRTFHGLLHIMRDHFSSRTYRRRQELGRHSYLERMDSRTGAAVGDLYLTHRSHTLAKWTKDGCIITIYDFPYAGENAAKNKINKLLPIGFKVVVEEFIPYLVRTRGKKSEKYPIHPGLNILGDQVLSHIGVPVRPL